MKIKGLALALIAIAINSSALAEVRDSDAVNTNDANWIACQSYVYRPFIKVMIDLADRNKAIAITYGLDNPRTQEFKNDCTFSEDPMMKCQESGLEFNMATGRGTLARGWFGILSENIFCSSGR